MKERIGKMIEEELIKRKITRYALLKLLKDKGYPARYGSVNSIIKGETAYVIDSIIAICDVLDLDIVLVSRKEHSFVE